MLILWNSKTKWNLDGFQQEKNIFLKAYRAMFIATNKQILTKTIYFLEGKESNCKEQEMPVLDYNRISQSSIYYTIAIAFLCSKWVRATSSAFQEASRQHHLQCMLLVTLLVLKETCCHARLLQLSTSELTAHAPTSKIYDK